MEKIAILLSQKRPGTTAYCSPHSSSHRYLKWRHLRWVSTSLNCILKLALFHSMILSMTKILNYEKLFLCSASCKHQSCILRPYSLRTVLKRPVRAEVAQSMGAGGLPATSTAAFCIVLLLKRERSRTGSAGWDLASWINVSISKAIIVPFLHSFIFLESSPTKGQGAKRHHTSDQTAFTACLTLPCLHLPSQSFFPQAAPALWCQQEYSHKEA